MRHPVVMTSLTLAHVPLAAPPLGWLRLLLRVCAGGASAERLEDWQLRDLNLTRPWPGPGYAITPWIP